LPQNDSLDVYPSEQTSLPDQQHCRTGSETLEPNVALAVERLNGFAFVGLEEEWSLSVCLFHVMLGGECFAVEDEVTRSGEHSKDGVDLAELDKADPFDSILYAAVKRRFYQDLALHNVTNERCKTVCSSFADSSFARAR